MYTSHSAQDIKSTPRSDTSTRHHHNSNLQDPPPADPRLIILRVLSFPLPRSLDRCVRSWQKGEDKDGLGVCAPCCWAAKRSRLGKDDKLGICYWVGESLVSAVRLFAKLVVCLLGGCVLRRLAYDNRL